MPTDHSEEIVEQLRKISQQLDNQEERLRRLEVNAHMDASAVDERGHHIPPFMRGSKSVSVSAPQSVPTSQTLKSGDFESVFGVNYLSKIGMVGLLIGIGFFLKYSFDNGWIGPLGRILIGYVIGLLFLGVGEYYKKTFTSWSRVFTGGGLAVLYFATYAAQHFYQLLAVEGATIIMSAITILSAVLSVRYRSIVVVLFGMVGGYMTPGFIGGVQNTSLLFQMMYIVILNLGVLAVAYARRWAILASVSLLVTVGFTQYWYDMADRTSLFAFITINFVLFSAFALVTAFVHASPREDSETDEIASLPLEVYIPSILTNATYFFGYTHALFYGQYGDRLSLVALALFGLYALQAYGTRMLNKEKQSYFPFAFLACAFAFVMIALALAFDAEWMTISWAVFATAIIVAGCVLREYLVRVLGFLVFTGAFFRLLVVNTASFNAAHAMPIANPRFLAYAVVILGCYIIAYAYLHYRDHVRSDEGSMPRIAIILAQILTLLIGTLEIYDFVGGDQRAQTAVSVLWALYAIIAIILGFATRQKYIRLFGLLLFACAIVKIVFIDLFQLVLLYRIIAFIFLGGVMIFASYLYQRYDKQIERS